MNRIIYSGFILFILFSCRKDKLEGDKSLLIGKWKWVSTDIFFFCGSTTGADLFYTATGNEFSIEFLKKGFIYYYENGVKVKCDRIVFENFQLHKDLAFKVYRFNSNWHSMEFENELIIGSTEFSISVYPNPAQGKFNININGKVGSYIIEIFTISGQIIKQINHILIDVLPLTIQTDYIDPGIYFISVVNSNGEKHVDKIIIN